MLIKKLTCCALLLFIIFQSLCVFALEKLVINESFNTYPTNAQPESMVKDSKSFYISEYATGEKGLALPLLAKETEVSFEGRITGDFCVSFDFVSMGDPFSGSLTLADDTGQSFTPVSFSENSGIFTQRNRRIGGYAPAASYVRLTNITIAVHTDSEAYDVYFGGKPVLAGWPIEQEMSGFSALNFKFISSYDNSVVLLDNINVFTGDTPLCSYPAAKASAEVLPPVEKEEIAVGDKILFYQDFDEAMTVGMNIYPSSNRLEISEVGGGYCLALERLSTNTSNFYCTINYNNSVILYPNFVATMDIMLEDDTNADIFFFRDGGTGTCINGKISGSSLIFSGKTVASMSYQSWYSVSCAFNFIKKTYDVYVDGKKEASNLPFANQSIGTPIHMRVSVPGGASANFCVDNILIYEGYEPREITKEEIEEKWKSAETLLPSETNEINALAGYTALHLQSGVLYNNEEKALIPLPYYEASTPMVPVRAFCEGLGFSVTYDEVNSAVSVGDILLYKTGEATMSVYGKETAIESAPAFRDGRIYVPLPSLLKEGLGKVAYFDDTCENPGLVVFGDKNFNPSASALQKINNFVLYYRPKANEILQNFEKTNPNNEHPRLMGRAEDYAAIRSLAETDGILRGYIEKLLEQADNANASAPVLGFAYQLTKNPEYAGRAYEVMKRTIDNTIWANGQYLDVGSNSLSVALGYDFTYEILTVEERTHIEEGLYRQALDDAMRVLRGQKGSIGSTFMRPNNWAEVCAGGIAVAAIAVMDVYPELCSSLLQHFSQSVEVMLSHTFTPDGATEEGPSYFSYGKQYLYAMFQAMDYGIGTDFNITTLTGFAKSAEFIFNMCSTTDINFNFGDSGEDGIPTNNVMWVAKKTGQKDLLAALYSRLKNTAGANIREIIFFYEPWMNDYQYTLPLDAHYRKVEAGVMRESWTVPGATYAAFKGGEYVSSDTHKQMDNGTFVFDSMGERWALDFGSENYSALSGTGYNIWEMKTGRWYVFRHRATGHNTVVINPKTNYPADHAYDANTYITSMQSKEKGAIGILDMTQALKNDASSAKRGYFLTDDRKSFVVRDEIALNATSEVYWLMYTRAADAEIDGNTVFLQQNGKTLRLEFITSSPAQVLWEDALPLEGTPPLFPAENTNKGIKRLALKMTASGQLRITVKLTPGYMEGSSVEDYNKSIDLWTIPDGTVTDSAAQLQVMEADMIYIDGMPLENFSKTNYSYNLLVVDGDEKLPQASAQSKQYNVSVEQAKSNRDKIKIKITSKDNAKSYGLYTIDFTVIPKVIEVPGLNSVQVRYVTTSSVQQEENPPVHMLDGDEGTRWAAEGLGEWAIFDLGKPTAIDTMAMSVYNGNARQQYFNICVSDDGETFTPVYKDGESGGKTTGLEMYSFERVTARYVRVTFNRTSAGNWNSPTEIIFGTKN